MNKTVIDPTDTALEEFQRRGTRTTGQIAELLGYTLGGANKIIKRLVARGQVENVERGIWRLAKRR